MKTKLNLMAPIFLMLLTFGCSFAAPEKKSYSPTVAYDAVETACRQAAKESKSVFLKSGFPECVWCNVFDRYHETPEVKKILEKYYVVVAIDTENMPDGKAVFSQYALPSAPSWVILTPEKKVVIDSYGPDWNVGYPNKPKETAYYLAALKKATPTITDDELKALSGQIQNAAKKK